MTTDNNLIPCRCGAIPYVVGSFDFGYKVACVRDECNDFAAGTWATGNTEDEAIAAWNRRASPTTAPAGWRMVPEAVIHGLLTGINDAIRTFEHGKTRAKTKADRSSQQLGIYHLECPRDRLLRAMEEQSQFNATSRPSPWAPTHRHRKGGMYRVIARAEMETDLAQVVVYENAEGRVWVRPAEEFDDGRFTALPPAPGAAPVSAPVAAQDSEMVAVPRDLIGAACSAIDQRRDAPKTLAELRRYSTGDRSVALQAQPSDLPPGLVLVATPYRANHPWMLIEMSAPGRATVITDGCIETEAAGVAHAHYYRGTTPPAAQAQPSLDVTERAKAMAWAQDTTGPAGTREGGHAA